jgi:hypothetical protein
MVIDSVNIGLRSRPLEREVEQADVDHDHDGIAPNPLVSVGDAPLYIGGHPQAICVTSLPRIPDGADPAHPDPVVAVALTANAILCRLPRLAGQGLSQSQVALTANAILCRLRPIAQGYSRLRRAMSATRRPPLPARKSVTARTPEHSPPLDGAELR